MISHLHVKKEADLKDLKARTSRPHPLATTLFLGRHVFLLNGWQNKVFYYPYYEITSIINYFRDLRNYDTDKIKAILSFSHHEEDSCTTRVLIHTKLGFKELQQHLEENFTFGCGCSYDCCGHWFGNPWQHLTRGPFLGFYSIALYSARNV